MLGVRVVKNTPSEGLGVGGEAGCVPAVVTGELAIQV
jgi:hypothetical protein